MSRPVSLLVWRDAETDPPTGDMARTVVALYGASPVAVRAYAVTGKSGVWWAELPVVSDLTDDDVRLASGVLHEEGTSQQYEPYLVAHRKLDAALGGEKEKT